MSQVLFKLTGGFKSPIQNIRKDGDTECITKEQNRKRQPLRPRAQSTVQHCPSRTSELLTDSSLLSKVPYNEFKLTIKKEPHMRIALDEYDCSEPGHRVTPPPPPPGNDVLNVCLLESSAAWLRIGPGCCGPRPSAAVRNINSRARDSPACLHRGFITSRLIIVPVFITCLYQL